MLLPELSTTGSLFLVSLAFDGLETSFFFLSSSSSHLILLGLDMLDSSVLGGVSFSDGGFCGCDFFPNILKKRCLM